MFQVCSAEFTNLSRRLFDAYIEHRVEPLIGTIEPGMYLGDFDWNDCPKPTGMCSKNGYLYLHSTYESVVNKGMFPHGILGELFIVSSHPSHKASVSSGNK